MRVGVATIAIAATLVAGCPKDDAPPEESPPTWKTVLDQPALDRAVLSLWGTGSRDVFAVGGPLGNGQETLALHFDGDAWTELHPGGTSTFWWVNGSSSNDVWMTGTEGRIAHWDGKTFKDYASGTAATIFGVIAFAPNDAWCVGGTPEGGTAKPNDVVLHYDGTQWTPEVLPGAPLGRTHFKVWGTRSSDLWVVGEATTIWHRAGTTWSRVDTTKLGGATLRTVTGCAVNDVWAVGDRSVLHFDGTVWSAALSGLFADVNGVACLGVGSTAIVGSGGSKQRLVDGKWIDEFDQPPPTDLHGAWADVASGAYWAAGGDFASGPSPGTARRGVIARFGPGNVATTLKK
jgi:hypothetical protein